MIGLSPLSTGHPNPFQRIRVRPSSRCYPTFSLPMDRSPGFGSHPTNYGRPIKTRFRYAFIYRLKLARKTNSLTHYTRGTRSPRKEAPTACRHSVSGTISLPSSGCFSPFPHGTGSLSVIEEYLGLEGGPPMFRQDFSCPALLKDTKPSYPYGAITHYGLPFQTVLVRRLSTTGLVRVRSPLLAESLLMSFPPGTEMFQFPGFASLPYVFR